VATDRLLDGAVSRSCAAAVAGVAIAAGVTLGPSDGPVGLALPAHAQFLPPAGQDYGWTTIGMPGNAPYDGRYPTSSWEDDLIIGRGRVDQTYRIQTGVFTVGQWLEYSNTLASNPANAAVYSRLPTITQEGLIPIGVVQDFNYQGPGT
jgi:hypothetical protein